MMLNTEPDGNYKARSESQQKRFHKDVKPNLSSTRTNFLTLDDSKTVIRPKRALAGKKLKPMHTEFKRDHHLHISGNSNSTLPFYKEINKLQDFYGQLLKSTINSKQITLKP